MCSVNRFGDSSYSATVKDDTGSVRAQAPRTKTSGMFSDEELLKRSTTFIHNIFKKKYQDKKKRDTNITLHQFVDDMLSSGSISLPSFIPGLQKVLESELNREQIPQSKSSLSNRWSRIKRINNYDLNYFLLKFKDFNKQEENVEEFRSITFTIGKVLNEGVDYNRFLHILNSNQKIATYCVLGVQHLLSIITDMVLSGDMNSIFNAENQQKRTQFFDFTRFNIANLEIDEADKVALLDDITLFESKNVFSQKQFYAYLSCCIGDKRGINRTP
jgi:hypothetical protein